MFFSYTPIHTLLGVGFEGVFGFGLGTSVDINFVTRGPEASFAPVITATQFVGGGASIDFMATIGVSNYIGDVSRIRRKMLETNTLGNGDIPTFCASLADTEGPAIGAGINATYTDGTWIIRSTGSIGAGLPAPAFGAGGVSNTWVLYDCYRK